MFDATVTLPGQGTYTGGYYSCHDDVRAKMYAHRYINGTRVPGQLYWDAYNTQDPVQPTDFDDIFGCCMICISCDIFKKKQF